MAMKKLEPPEETSKPIEVDDPSTERVEQGYFRARLDPEDVRLYLDGSDGWVYFKPNDSLMLEGQWIIIFENAVIACVFKLGTTRPAGPLDPWLNEAVPKYPKILKLVERTFAKLDLGREDDAHTEHDVRVSGAYVGSSGARLTKSQRWTNRSSTGFDHAPRVRHSGSADSESTSTGFAGLDPSDDTNE